MEAILTAGGTPHPRDPLYSLSQGEPKTMITILGRPILQWIFDALETSPAIDSIILVGLPEPFQKQVHSPLPITFLPDQGTLMGNILAGLEAAATARPEPHATMLLSSDIPALTPEAVEWMVEQARQRPDADLLYTVATRKLMEATFPGSKRTYVHLKDMDVCGGDMVILHTRMLQASRDLWQRLIESRKKPLQQAAMIGFDTLFLALTGQLTLAQAEQRVAARLNLRGRVIPTPFAGSAMDVDKPGQFTLIESFLREREPK